MVVSMLLVILELPETAGIKDKRRVITGIKRRLQTKYRLSCAEVDLQDSLRFAQLGAAIVSNSSEFGEKVLRDAVRFIEDWFPVILQEVQVHSEIYE